jgi:anion-transporting  ArsA/GET3 family ATPase
MSSVKKSKLKFPTSVNCKQCDCLNQAMAAKEQRNSDLEEIIRSYEVQNASLLSEKTDLIEYISHLEKALNPEQSPQKKRK